MMKTYIDGEKSAEIVWPVTGFLQYNFLDIQWVVFAENITGVNVISIWGEM